MPVRAAGLRAPGLLRSAAGHGSDGPGQTLEARLLATGRIRTSMPVQAAVGHKSDGTGKGL